MGRRGFYFVKGIILPERAYLRFRALFFQEWGQNTIAPHFRRYNAAICYLWFSGVKRGVSDRIITVFLGIITSAQGIWGKRSPIWAYFQTIPKNGDKWYSRGKPGR
jgi:hypothetical protein